MRTPIIAGNWKMYKTVADAVKYVKEFRALVKDVIGVEIVVAPAFTALHAVAEAARNSNVIVAAQDVHWEREGAFTGEVSAAMIRDTGAQWVIVGHSERRTLFGETDGIVNAKTKAALAAGLTPIVCVGETLEEREANRTQAVVTTQINDSLAGLTPADVAKIVIAYEPVWAIGTGKVASPQQAQEVHALIRGLLASLASPAIADSVRIQYGGSVKPDNAAELAAQPDIDGALVGGASLKADDFLGIARAFA
jgi:triosephosphate isomerase